MRDTLTAWEKAALITTGAASAYNVLLWALGATLTDAAPGLTPLGVARVAFAVLSFVSFDLVVIVTVQAMRAGRRGLWSEASAAAAAFAAALVALEVAGVVAWLWLHAAPAVVLYAFMRHLSQPVSRPVAPVTRLVALPSPVVATPDATPDDALTILVASPDDTRDTDATRGVSVRTLQRRKQKAKELAS